MINFDGNCFHSFKTAPEELLHKLTFLPIHTHHLIAFKGKINEHTLNLLTNLVLRKRDNLIESILHKFNELYNAQMNIEESLITTTFDLDQKSLEVVKGFAEKITNKNISLVNDINKEIVGGFNLKIGDRMIDCTVSSKLKSLRKKLINN